MKEIQIISLDEITATKSGSVDPSKFPDEVFDLYSIPAFDSKKPEVVTGKLIGSTKQIVQPGDVLLSKIVPHIRRSWVVGETLGRRIIASGEWIVFRSEKIYPNYLRHVLVSDPFHSKFMSTVSGVGGSLLRARPAFVVKIKIPLPSLPEQQRIADILDRAEALRAKRQATLAQLDELVQSIFIEMFGDLVENPKRWNLKRIGDIAEVKTGGTPSRNNEEYWQNGTLPWVKTTEIKENIIYETEECITESGFQNSNVTLLPQNSILIAMYGQGKTRGRTAKLGIHATTNQACAAILPSDKYETDFLWTFLRFSYDALRNLGRGGNQPNLNLSIIKDFKVYSPPLEIQKQFSEILGSIEKVKQSQQQSSLEINNLFDALMHEAFTGKLFLQ
jgi:type I restriction enzyme S subunit